MEDKSKPPADAAHSLELIATSINKRVEHFMISILQETSEVVEPHLIAGKEAEGLDAIARAIAMTFVANGVLLGRASDFPTDELKSKVNDLIDKVYSTPIPTAIGGDA